MSSDVRVVCHIDMDAFYCQVECGLNPELKGKPIAVVQYNPSGGLEVPTLRPSDNRCDVTNAEYNSIIAVSYPARACGVKRLQGSSGQDAKKKCPELICVHVPTAHKKADLTIYRHAGQQVIAALQRVFSTNDCVMEKASVDEVFIDITKLSRKMLKELSLSEIDDLIKEAKNNNSIAGADLEEVKMGKNDIRCGHAPTSVDNQNTNDEKSNWLSRPRLHFGPDDLLLLCGAKIVTMLRKAVLDDLGYTCSGGIGHNKMLAKIASAMHKPNRQTIVPSGTVTDTILHSMPLGRVVGFGGKLGKQIEEICKVSTLGELWSFGASLGNRAFMMEKLSLTDEQTDVILSKAKGIDNDEVQNRTNTKTIGASKTFRNQRKILPSGLNDGTCATWFREIAHDLIERVQSEFLEHNRKPSTFVVGCNLIREASDTKDTVDWKGGGSISKSASYPPFKTKAEELAVLALSCLNKILLNVELPWHISYLTLSATNFVDVAEGTSSIESFLQPQQIQQTQQTQQIGDKCKAEVVPYSSSSASSSVSPPPKSTSSSSTSSTAAATVYSVTGMGDIDMAVLRELPLEIQLELMGQKKEKKNTFFSGNSGKPPAPSMTSMMSMSERMNQKRKRESKEDAIIRLGLSRKKS